MKFLKEAKLMRNKIMMGTINCVYETPCGWCSKWDKKCNKKAPERGQRIKCNPIDDARSPVSWEEKLG